MVNITAYMWLERVTIMHKLDQLDLKIIQQLQTNGRISSTELAEKTGSSRQTLANRLKRMIEEDLVIIKGGLNLRKFGFKIAHVGLEVKTSEARKEIKQHLKTCPRVLTVSRTPEKANIHFRIWGEDDQTINSIIESFRDHQNVDIIYSRYMGTPIHGNIVIKVESNENNETPCELNCSDCPRHINAQCSGCPASSNYRNPLLKRK